MHTLPVGLTLFLAALSLIPASLYLDATHHRIGKLPGDSSMSAGAWALWALIPSLGFLGVIAYLLNRHALIRRAGTDPVTVPQTRRLITYFLLLAASSAITPFWWLVVRHDSP